MACTQSGSECLSGVDASPPCLVCLSGEGRDESELTTRPSVEVKHFIPTGKGSRIECWEESVMSIAY